MGITGRYDFKGIQKAVSRAVDILLATTTWGAWILASPFKPVVTAAENLLTNFLANRGLILLDIGAIMVDGSVDQTKLDDALDAGLKRVMQGRDKITAKEGAKIDQDVVDAFDNDVDLDAATPLVPDVPSSPVRTRGNSPL